MTFDLLTTFQSFRTILCVCPCCNEVHRLSDLRLKFEGKAEHTWLDTIEEKGLKLDEKETVFEEREAYMRQLAAERGRKKVADVVRKSMVKEYADLKLNPYDIKPLLHPVDYVVFDGMEEGKMEEVFFLSKSTRNPAISALRRQIRKAVEAKSYLWKVARVGVDGKVEWE